ncbi:hypothetical protein LH23_17640 [Cedecea neteri]|uniref:Uncharacterized protein n=1 Tax=Cedecea neteri TaxID=158822 RepID=A0AAN0VUV5_9ENTR|nr:hypothetical protein LH23_17640 [Cedecea neteri]
MGAIIKPSDRRHNPFCDLCLICSLRQGAVEKKQRRVGEYVMVEVKKITMKSRSNANASN